MPLTRHTLTSRTGRTLTRRRSRIAAAAAGTVATALLLSACGPAETPQIAAPLGMVVESSTSGVLPLEKTFDPAQTAIVGPHFALAVSGAQFSKKIDAAKAAELKLDGPLTAPAGYEVLVMQTSPDFDVDPAIGGRSEAKAVLELGDRKVELDDVPKPGDMVAAIAPADADARLVVTDAGKRFTVNLRTGVHEEFVKALLDSPPGLTSYGEAGPYEEEMKAQTSKWQVTFGATVRSFKLTRSAWEPDFEWAPDGKLWVQVDFAFQQLWKGSDTQLEWTLDPAASVLLKVGDQEIKATKSDASDPQDQFIEYRALFEIDPTVTAVKLVFKPSGDLKIVDGGSRSSMDFTKGPATGDWDVDFAG